MFALRNVVALLCIVVISAVTQDADAAPEEQSKPFEMFSSLLREGTWTVSSFSQDVVTTGTFYANATSETEMYGFFTQHDKEKDESWTYRWQIRPTGKTAEWVWTQVNHDKGSELGEEEEAEDSSDEVASERTNEAEAVPLQRFFVLNYGAKVGANGLIVEGHEHVVKAEPNDKPVRLPVTLFSPAPRQLRFKILLPKDLRQAAMKKHEALSQERRRRKRKISGDDDEEDTRTGPLLHDGWAGLEQDGEVFYFRRVDEPQPSFWERHQLLILFALGFMWFRTLRGFSNTPNAAAAGSAQPAPAPGAKPKEE